MNQLAEELNHLIVQKSPFIYRLLSSFGKKLYFPKGILAQSQEAKEKAHKFNATVGIATEGNQPMFLPSIQRLLPELDPKDVYPYAPSSGKPALRKVWMEKIYDDNPRLKGKKISLPIVTCGITHGLSLVGDLFVNPANHVILPDKYWGNYKLIYETRYQSKITTFPLFNPKNQFNLQGFKSCLERVGKENKKMIILLNFPNNPTGYTPTIPEADEIRNIVKQQAEKGSDIIIVIDDAYFNLFYEDTLKESLFSYFVGLHDNILSIKLDGATKEQFAWGFRVGFVTFGLGDHAHSEEVYSALEKKVLGGIRSKLSNAPHLSQTLVLKALESPNHKQDCKKKFDILKRRAVKVKEVLRNPKYDSVWSVYPFNSGYFMCIKLKQVNAEKLRQHILDKYGVGVISSGDFDVRVALSCVEKENIQELFDTIYLGVQDLT